MRLRFMNRIGLGVAAALTAVVAAAQCPLSLDSGNAIATEDGLLLSRFESGARGSPALNTIVPNRLRFANGANGLAFLKM